MDDLTKVKVEYDPKVVKLTPDEWKGLGGQMSHLIAVILKTPEHRLIPSRDIDFVHVAYPDGYIGHTVAIKIETVGYPERKAKVTENMVLALKDDFLGHFRQYGISFDAKNKLIWLNYIPPDGHYV